MGLQEIAIQLIRFALDPTICLSSSNVCVLPTGLIYSNVLGYSRKLIVLSIKIQTVNNINLILPRGLLKKH